MTSSDKLSKSFLIYWMILGFFFMHAYFDIYFFENTIYFAMTSGLTKVNIFFKRFDLITLSILAWHYNYLQNTQTSNQQNYPTNKQKITYFKLKFIRRL